MTTFGFECEFQSNAEALAPRLYDINLAGADRMHSYHCDCETCQYIYPETAWPLRMQTDSSCSGEVISRPYQFREEEDDWTDLLSQLADAAVDVDAEPGLDAGFHVHVGNGGASVVRKARAFYAFLSWESVLVQIASGRFPLCRYANRTVDESLYWFAKDRRYLVVEDDGTRLPFWPEYEQEMAEELWGEHSENDRHSNLNLSTRHGGFEIRLWNSTRAAWRMELWIRLSVAFARPSFVNHLLSSTPARNDDDFVTIAEALALDDQRAVSLLMRQVHYLHHRVHLAPSVLSVA